MADAPRVFLSYSHDSDEHADRVLALADALCDGGIEVILDRYVHPAPAEGWPRWMERNLDAAQFVVMVCTETYRRRVMGEEEPGQGTGVRWEGTLIYNRIAYGEPGGIRFIPILLPGAEPTHIPDPVRGHNHYRLAIFDLTDPGYEALYRHLTGQPATARPDLGPIKRLPPRPRPQPSPGPLPPAGGPWWNVPSPGNVSSSSTHGADPSDRISLVMSLRQLNPSDFATLVAMIEGAASQISRHGTVPEQVADLMRWAESPTGPGLAVIEDVFRNFHNARRGEGREPRWASPPSLSLSEPHSLLRFTLGLRMKPACKSSMCGFHAPTTPSRG